MSKLTIEHLQFHRAERVILPDICFAVKAGAFACLLGPSGCGKTTLLRLIAGLEAHQAGCIRLDGVALSDASSVLPPDQRGIGMVFQQPSLFPTMNVSDNIGFGIRHLERELRHARITELLSHIGLADRADAMPHQLSGGQQHRVALARSLAPRPKLLLLDEPFAHLDPVLRLQLRRDTRALIRREGSTAMMVTHDATEAMQMADQIILMDKGGLICQIGTPHDVYHHPQDCHVALALGEMNLLPARREGNRIECLFGGMEFSQSAGGEPVIGVRPQDFMLSHSESGVKATVLSVLCTGPEDDLELKLEDGQLLQVRESHHYHWSVGDDVYVSVKPDRLHLFA